MCGIAGIINQRVKPAQRKSVERMVSTLEHRGPDSNGVSVAGSTGLGHTRLAIIDLSADGNQPMCNETNDVAVVYNGEIYNFQQLRADLVQKGHRFRSRSDTEVLVHAWEEYGERCVDRLRGMFSFAILDESNEVAFLARDRVGKKPLYYAVTRDGLVFGSEIKAVLQAPGVDRTLDAVAVGEYAAYGNSLGERTIYAGIRKLPPGHALSVHTEDDGVRLRKDAYWRMRLEPEEEPEEEEWLERLDEALCESVRLRLVSDVPLGVFLSGGIDSSLVIAYMVKNGCDSVKTFTIGFDHAAFDETRHARLVSEYFKTDHHTEILQASSLDMLPELIATYDEPFADLSAVPTWCLSRMTSGYVKVALSGDGGDELFAGYKRYAGTYALDSIGRLIGPAGRRLASWASDALPRESVQQRMLERLTHRGFELYDHVMGCSQTVLGLLGSKVRTEFRQTTNRKMLHDYLLQTELSHLERYQVTDFNNYLPDDVLVKVDRASMRHSLEVRCPLLDQYVVELAARIPIRYKLGGLTGKRILRKLLARYLPREMFERPKTGFGVPFGTWFRGALYGLIDNMLEDGNSPMWEYFDRTRTKSMVLEQRTRAPVPPTLLWRLVLFHRWCAAKLS